MTPSQPLGFGELLAGGVLITAGISGHTIRDVLAGRASPLRPLVSASPTGATVAGGGPGGGAGGAAAPPTKRSGSRNPVPGFQPGRIDQGVDFAPTHDGQPIYAPADGTVIKTGAPGWPGGAGGVLLNTADGVMFFYESLTATVHAGQKVKAGQQIARAHTGGTGIEIGFADRNGVPLAHAGYTEGKVTNWGRKMADYLRGLGVKGIG